MKFRHRNENRRLRAAFYSHGFTTGSAARDVSALPAGAITHKIQLYGRGLGQCSDPADRLLHNYHLTMPAGTRQPGFFPSVFDVRVSNRLFYACSRGGHWPVDGYQLRRPQAQPGPGISEKAPQRFHLIIRVIDGAHRRSRDRLAVQFEGTRQGQRQLAASSKAPGCYNERC